MPVLTNVAHFLNLIVENPEVFQWQNIKDITGLEVVPFNPACTASQINFPQEKYAEATAFFRAYQTYDTSQTRSKFLRTRNDAYHDGRAEVKKWVAAKWKEWRISERVTDALKDAGFDGFQYHKDMEGGAVRFFSFTISEISNDRLVAGLPRGTNPRWPFHSRAGAVWQGWRSGQPEARQTISHLHDPRSIRCVVERARQGLDSRTQSAVLAACKIGR